MLMFYASACKSSEDMSSNAESTIEVTNSLNKDVSNDETIEKTYATENNNVSDISNSSQGNTNLTNNKNSVNSNSTHSNSNNKHIHNFLQATCTAPKKCECGATEGTTLGHNWQEATCSSPQVCSVCKITQGTVGIHIIENGLCQFCKQPQVISPENLDISKAYIHFLEIDPFVFEETYYENVIMVDFITFGKDFNGDIGQRGLYSSNKYQSSDLTDSIKYNGNDYYYIGIGGVGIFTTYEIKDNDIIIRDFYNPTRYAIINLLSDRTIKVIYKTDDFRGNWKTQVGWAYLPIDKWF